MDCIVLYCIEGLHCIVLYYIEGLHCILLYCMCIEGWSRIWPSNEFIPHHTSAPPDHRPRVYKTKKEHITMLEGWTDHIHTAVLIVQYRVSFSAMFVFLSDPSPIIGNACQWLTHWLTNWLLVNLIDVTLVCEDGNSKLVEVVNVTHVDDEKSADYSLVKWSLVIILLLMLGCGYEV